jgi:hypothetical protein
MEPVLILRGKVSPPFWSQLPKSALTIAMERLIWVESS